MSGDLQSHYGKAQRETAELLGYDLARLTPEQSLRLDCAVALRLALDDLQGRIVRGESIDVGRMLTAAEALGRILPPAVLASPPPAADAPDPREIMWQNYLGMRKRGELFDPCSTYEGMKAEVERLRAEIAALKAAGAPAASPPATAAPADNVVKLRGNPDPVRAREVAAPAARPAPSVPVAGELVMVVDPSSDESWRDYVEPDGSIRSTPFSRGKYWGPV